MGLMLFLFLFLLMATPGVAMAQEDGNAGPRQTLEEGLNQTQSTDFYWDPAEKPCTLCYVVDIIVQPAEAAGLAIANLFQPTMFYLWGLMFGIWVVFSGLTMMIPGALDLKKAIVQFSIGILITVVLESMTVPSSIIASGGDLRDTGNLWFDFIYVPIRDVSVGLSAELISEIVTVSVVLSGGSSSAVSLPLPPNTTEMATLSQLFALIETSIFNVAIAGFFDQSGTWTFIANFFKAVLLAIPFLFVLLIFAAFILESAFKFLAITATSPLWVAAAFFPFSRPWATAAIRIYFSAAFTILFAAMAMGFTIGVVEMYRLEFTCSMRGDAETCGLLGFADREDLGNSSAGFMEGVQLEWLKFGQFWVMLFIGMVSVLLHLKAPTLAANISGANDSAAPAAAVVAGGKMLAGGAIFSSLRGAAGFLGVPKMADKAREFAHSGGATNVMAKGTSASLRAGRAWLNSQTGRNNV